MGTRADYYIGNDPATMEWIGSHAYDGYALHEGDHDEYDAAIAQATTAKGFRKAVQRMLQTLNHATFPDQGWPWSWDDSQLTDYAYCFVGHEILCYQFGHGPRHIGEPFCNDEGDGWGDKAPFQDMSARKNVTLGKRSGLMILRVDGT